MKIGKYWVRPGSIADNFLKFWIGGTMGLVIGAIIALGMNEIHPLI